MLDEKDIAAEMQYAPASSLEAARKTAARAIAIRRILEARARELGLLESGERSEAVVTAAMEAVLEAEIDAPAAGEDACREWFDAHPGEIRSPDLFEASHILFAAAPDDAVGRASALAAATAAIAEIERKPERFEAIARESSACPSGANGGSLGQIVRGATVPEFETYLFALEAGELCPTPIASRYGYHVGKVTHRADGRALPYQAARPRIARMLDDLAYRAALTNYLRRLAEQAGVAAALE